LLYESPYIVVIFVTEHILGIF